MKINTIINKNIIFVLCLAILTLLTSCGKQNSEILNQEFTINSDNVNEYFELYITPSYDQPYIDEKEVLHMDGKYETLVKCDIEIKIKEPQKYNVKSIGAFSVENFNLEIGDTIEEEDFVDGVAKKNGAIVSIFGKTKIESMGAAIKYTEKGRQKIEIIGHKDQDLGDIDYFDVTMSENAVYNNSSEETADNNSDETNETLSEGERLYEAGLRMNKLHTELIPIYEAIKNGEKYEERGAVNGTTVEVDPRLNNQEAKFDNDGNLWVISSNASLTEKDVVIYYLDDNEERYGSMTFEEEGYTEYFVETNGVPSLESSDVLKKKHDEMVQKYYNLNDCYGSIK